MLFQVEQKVTSTSYYRQNQMFTRIIESVLCQRFLTQLLKVIYLHFLRYLIHHISQEYTLYRIHNILGCWVYHMIYR